MKVTDKITITNEDNMVLMSRYPDDYFELAIVDPPYGIGFGEFNRTNKANKKSCCTNKNVLMKNKVYNANCFELMKEIEANSIDLVLTDPPFGMNFQSNSRKIKHKSIKNDDNLDWLGGWVKELKRICKNEAHLYIFCSWHKIETFKAEFSKHFNVKNILIWEKNNTGMGDLYGDYAPKYEMILFISNGQKKLNGKRDSNIIKAKKTGNIHHPTEKPTNLMEYFIEKSSKKGDLIFDSFAGSGSTLIAAKRLERSYLGIEIDEKYFDRINSRIEEEAQQIRMF